MNRRFFLRALPAAVVGVALTDPTKLLPAPLAFHPDAFAMAAAGFAPVQYISLAEYQRLFPPAGPACELAWRIDSRIFQRVYAEVQQWSVVETS